VSAGSFSRDPAKTGVESFGVEYSTFIIRY
jgi:hypothetical protein